MPRPRNSDSRTANAVSKRQPWGSEVRLQRDYSDAPGVVRLGMKGVTPIECGTEVMIQDENGICISWEEATGAAWFPTPDEIEQQTEKLKALKLAELRESGGPYRCRQGDLDLRASIRVCKVDAAGPKQHWSMY